MSSFESIELKSTQSRFYDSNINTIDINKKLDNTVIPVDFNETQSVIADDDVSSNYTDYIISKNYLENLLKSNINKNSTFLLCNMFNNIVIKMKESFEINTNYKELTNNLNEEIIIYKSRKESLISNGIVLQLEKFIKKKLFDLNISIKYFLEQLFIFENVSEINKDKKVFIGIFNLVILLLNEINNDSETSLLEYRFNNFINQSLNLFSSESDIKVLEKTINDKFKYKATLYENQITNVILYLIYL